MGKTIFHDVYSLSKFLSTYLPLSSGLPLDVEMDFDNPYSIPKKSPEGEHWAVIAKTGDGKTVFDKALLRCYRKLYPWINTYIVDSKHLGDFTEKDGKIWVTYDPPPVLTGAGQKQVWQPIFDDIDSYSQYFLNILHAGKPALVLVDESKNLKKGQKYPKGYELILSQGRLPGIHVITNYQEVANGLRQGLSQAKHIVGFSAVDEYDLRMMKSFLRFPSFQQLPQKNVHDLFYINRDTMARAVLFRGYQDFVSNFMAIMTRKVQYNGIR